MRQAARWRPRNDRQIWLIVSFLVIAVCAEAMVIPAKRDGLACAVTGLIGLVAAGQKIRAIKRYRELTGVELKEAKVIIDRL